MLGNDIQKNYFPNKLDVLRGDFGGFGCPIDALLAKTMPMGQ